MEPRNSLRMERSLEEEEEEKGVHEIRVRVWGFEERVTSIGISERERSEDRRRRRRRRGCGSE